MLSGWLAALFLCLLALAVAVPLALVFVSRKLSVREAQQSNPYKALSPLLWAIGVGFGMFVLWHVPVVGMLAVIFFGALFLAPIDRLGLLNLGTASNGFFVPNSTGIVFHCVVSAAITYLLVYLLSRRSV